MQHISAAVSRCRTVLKPFATGAARWGGTSICNFSAPQLCTLGPEPITSSVLFHFLSQSPRSQNRSLHHQTWSFFLRQRGPVISPSDTRSSFLWSAWQSEHQLLHILSVFQLLSQVIYRPCFGCCETELTRFFFLFWPGHQLKQRMSCTCFEQTSTLSVK